MLSQFEHVVRHWRGADGNPSGAQHHGCGLVAAIEAILEFRKIARQMLIADGPVGAGDGVLDVARGGIHPLNAGASAAVRARSGDDRLMGAGGADTN